MRATRRQFLKGLIATAAVGAIAPLSLVESVHGASDLTPRERDIAAEVMGLSKPHWVVAVARDALEKLPPLRSAWALDNFGMPPFHLNCRCVPGILEDDEWCIVSPIDSSCPECDEAALSDIDKAWGSGAPLELHLRFTTSETVFEFGSLDISEPATIRGTGFVKL